MLIVGVNQPKSCYACSWYNKVECPVNDGRYYYRVQRHPACPLVEIPTPHGRLIAEKTITEIRYHDADGYHIVNGEQLCELEIDADTVIEAEGSET
jgi:hypothetical protein